VGPNPPARSRVYRARCLHATAPQFQRARRTGRPGRPPAFDPAAYRRRTVVERCVNRLEQWRGLATRFEKPAPKFRAVVVIAALMTWP
jgi:transposase